MYSLFLDPIYLIPLVLSESDKNDIYRRYTKLLPVLRTMAQSDAAKADVSMPQACYTAYVKSLECKCIKCMGTATM